jgi:hypothetical protein
MIAAACMGAGTLVSLQAGAETAPTFDPDAPIVLDHDGSEMPDEVAVMAAFDTRQPALDRCVAKVRRGTRTVAGTADLEVLLDPDGQRPLGVNAYLSEDAPKRPSLKECLRAEASRAPFPAYDGPPMVVAFSFELDPGFEEEEEEDA